MWVGLLTNRINSKLEKSNLINQHALNRKPVLFSPSPSPSPSPHDCKTWCGLIQDGSFTNCHGCVTYKFSYMYLWFSTLYSSSFGRTETVVFAKKNKTPISNMPRVYLALPPLPPSNVMEINKSRGGGGLIEDFGTWLKTYVRSKFNNKMLVKYWIIF